MKWDDDEPGDDDDFTSISSHYFESPLAGAATFTFSEDSSNKLVQLKTAKSASSPAKKKSAQAKKQEAARAFMARRNAKQLSESESATASIRNMAGKRSTKRMSESESATASIRNMAGKRSIKKKKKVLQRRTSDLERKVATKAKQVEKTAEKRQEAKKIGAAAAKKRNDNTSPDDSGEVVVESDALELPDWVKQKCILLGDPSFSMASRIMAQGNEKKRRMTRRRSRRRTLAKRKNKKTPVKKKQPSTRSSVTTLDDAFSSSKLSKEQRPSVIDAVSARRPTVSPAVAVAARRSSTNRMTQRVKAAAPTVKNEEVPELLSSTRARPGSARLLASRVPHQRSFGEMRVSSEQDFTRRDSSGNTVSNAMDRLSPLKVHRSGSVISSQSDHMPTTDSSARVQKARQLSVVEPSVKSIMASLSRKLEASKKEEEEEEEEVEEEEEDEEGDDDDDEDEQHMEQLRERAKEIQAQIKKKGLRLWKDASNYDLKRGCLKHVGTVKAAAELKKCPEILCLYRKPGALAYSEAEMRNEIEMSQKIGSFGVRVPEALSDVFEFKVDGTKTFGFLVERIFTTMSEPYKPQAHKGTWQGMGACLRALPTEQRNRALRNLQVIQVFNKFNHYLHDMQLLLQNNSQDESRNGIIYIIDPGALAPPKKVNQVFRVIRFVKKLLAKG